MVHTFHRNSIHDPADIISHVMHAACISSGAAPTQNQHQVCTSLPLDIIGSQIGFQRLCNQHFPEGAATSHLCSHTHACQAAMHVSSVCQESTVTQQLAEYHLPWNGRGPLATAAESLPQKVLACLQSKLSAPHSLSRCKGSVPLHLPGDTIFWLFGE